MHSSFRAFAEKVQDETFVLDTHLMLQRILALSNWSSHEHSLDAMPSIQEFTASFVIAERPEHVFDRIEDVRPVHFELCQFPIIVRRIPPTAGGEACHPRLGLDGRLLARHD